MLVVDKDIAFSTNEQVEWRKRSIETVRVDTMKEAIEKLNKDTYLFITINADNVNYMPLLTIIRDSANIPILLIGTNPTGEEQAEALNHGADAFAFFQDGAEKNINLALAYVRRYTERYNEVKKPPRAISCGNLILFCDYRQVFCDDAEIDLTKKEFDLLHLFFSNPNICLEFGVISRKVWCDDYADVSNNSIWQKVNKIRCKLDEANFNGGIIKNVRDVGYRFSPQYPR